MSAERKALRAAVVALLLASPQTGAGSRVFANSSTPLDEQELPCILVYPKSETAEEFDAPRRYRREVDMVIAVAARQATGQGAPVLDDVLDDICAQVEAKLFADERIGGKASDSLLTGVEFEFNGEGRQTIACARLTFRMSYISEAPTDQSGTLEPLEKAGTEWDLPPADTSLEAEDLVELPQP